VYTRVLEYCAFSHPDEGLFSKASAPYLFLEDENIFQKLGFMVAIIPQFPMEPWRPIFEKCCHLREKGGVSGY
jgi:hypothetical protein